MKTEMSVAKLVVKLGDRDEDVRAAAAQALSALGTKGSSNSWSPVPDKPSLLWSLFLDPFKDAMKSEKAVAKLVAKLTDSDDRVCAAVHQALLTLGKQG